MASIPSFFSHDRYSAVIAAAQTEYTSHYEASSAKLPALSELITTWTTRHTLLTNHEITPLPSLYELNEEFAGKVDVYIEYQELRNKLMRILAVFDEAIAHCSPPILDPSTLLVLKRLEVLNPETLDTKYTEIFSTQRTHLENQRLLVDQLLARVKSAVASLRQALEPLGILCNGPTGMMAAAAALGNSLTGQTPYVNAAVLAHKAQHSLTKET